MKFIRGLFVGSLVRIVVYGISTFIKLLVNILVFFGLYIPFFYLIYGYMLVLFCGFDYSVINAELGLYLFGLSLCCTCTLIITFKALITKPIKLLLGRDESQQPSPRKYKKQIAYNGRKFSRPKPVFTPPPTAERRYFRIESMDEYKERLESYFEKPLIYRHSTNPNLVIYEYSDKFLIYKIVGDMLEYEDTLPNKNIDDRDEEEYCYERY